MKKSSLVVALPALAFSALLLSGCGAFRSEKAWKSAQQEAPLEIPPGLDTPPATDALVIPPRGANNPTAAGATADVPGAAGQISDGFVVAGDVDSVYERVGKALSGDLGKVVSSDASAHGYTVNVAGAAAEKRGFFSRLFHRRKAGAAGQVQVSVGSNGQGTEIRAQGPAPAVARVIDGLKDRLGD